MIQKFASSLAALYPQPRTLAAEIAHGTVNALPPQELYDLLEAYYLTNGLYDGLGAIIKRAGLWHESMKELRNPAHRVVEFYAGKLWPGDLPRALPIVTDNKPIIKPIEQIWEWSNWSAEKQLAARWFAMMGDMFIKAAERESTEHGRQVFLQVLDPRHVTDFAQDERGFLTSIRIDVPQVEREWLNGHLKRTSFMYTEIWTKDRVLIFRHDKGRGANTELLGTALRNEVNPLGFVPISYAPFRKIGRERGLGAFTHCLTKIDEANRQATRMHALLFRHNNVVWALKANATDPAGRPLPPPALLPMGANTDSDLEPGLIKFGDDTFVALPGNSSLESLVPRLDYGSMLSILNAMLEDLRNDLPELRYYDMTIKSGVSGIAMRYALADAIDRVLEARGNAEACLIRAHMMALSLGQRAQITGFDAATIGEYKTGKFTHSFAAREIVPSTPAERADVATKLVQAGTPLIWALRQAGFTTEEIADLSDLQDEADKKAKEAKQEEQEQVLALQADMAGKARTQQAEDAAAALERQKDMATHQATVTAQAAAQRMEQQTALDIEKARQIAVAQADAAPPAPAKA